MTSPALRVLVSSDEGIKALEFPIDAELRLGREASCDVVLPSELVSRRHACVVARGDSLTVTDTSANGTGLGGAMLRRGTRDVPTGTSMKIGPFEISVSIDPGEEETGPLNLAPGLRRRIHGLLVESLDHRKIEPGGITPELRSDVRIALERLTREHAPSLRDRARRVLVEELVDEVLGLGPLEPLLADPTVSEVMVVDPRTVYVERRGRLERAPAQFTDAESVRAAIERIVTPLGRRIDESCPLVDARLPDGSRVNAIIPPLAVRGPCITIRKFRGRTRRLEELVGLGALTSRMRVFLERCVLARKNVVIAGGTGSGKTTLLDALSAVVPETERLVTVEDAAELRLAQPHVVTLEARGPNMEGKGAYTIRDLVKNALRMRPDRILVGECRAGEALDMLQAMNTGHDGSMTTVHANSPVEAVARLETLCLMSGLDVPVAAVRRQIAASVHVIAQAARFSDGTRRVTSISEVSGMSDSGDVRVEEIFRYDRTGTNGRGEVIGEFRSTGYVPSFIEEFIAAGLTTGGEFL